MNNKCSHYYSFSFPKLIFSYFNQCSPLSLHIPALWSNDHGLQVPSVFSPASQGHPADHPEPHGRSQVVCRGQHQCQGSGGCCLQDDHWCELHILISFSWLFDIDYIYQSPVYVCFYWICLFYLSSLFQRVLSFFQIITIMIKAMNSRGSVRSYIGIW